LLKATGLKLAIKPDRNDWSYIRNSYRQVGFDPRKFISLTRDYVVAKAVWFLRELKKDENVHEPTECELRWEHYPYYFGVEMFHPECCAFKIPVHLLDYQNPEPPAEVERSRLLPEADFEDFELPFDD